MAKLKPCPFCGGKASCKPFRWLGLTTYHVGCEDCGANTVEFDNPKEAIEVWNRRTDTCG